MEFLQDRAAAVRSRGQTRLAPIAELALQAKVAPATMWQAVRALCQSGILEARPRRGINAVAVSHIGPAAEPLPQARPAGQRWERVRDGIGADIVRGGFAAADVLPRAKQLMQRYGVCYQTLRKALLDLERERVIVPAGRGFRVAGLARRSAPATILLVEWVSGTEVLSALESECSRLGVRLQAVRFLPRAQLFDALARARHGRGSEAVIGFLLAITGGSPEQYREVLSAIVPTERPIAVLDQSGGATGVALPGGRALRVFTTADARQPGRDMGHYLLQSGHRCVAYLSAVHSALWSRGRLDGLREVYGRAGLAGGVRAFVAEHDTPPNTTAGRAQSELAWLTDRLQRRERPRERRLARAVRRLSGDLVAAMTWADVEDKLAPLMEQALAAKGASAWVAANDPLALTCLDFLRRRGVRVPQDIALAGFDDLMAAFDADLTSYNFNRRSAAQAAVAYLVGGAQARLPGTSGREVVIEGFVTPRASTAGR
jgi:DNA-binding LacI/PurR family transcriptional regulator/DNA-binding transcriptional regulator YhcF (GntR family)